MIDKSKDCDLFILPHYYSVLYCYQDDGFGNAILVGMEHDIPMVKWINEDLH